MTEESMLSRLVWYRNTKDDDVTKDWTPAVYYASHGEAIPALGGLAALQDDPLLQRTLTMQLIQEQIRAASVPLVRLIVQPTKHDSSTEEALSLQIRTIHNEEEKNGVELERDFVKHMIYLCAEETNAQVHRTQLQYVYQLLRQEEGGGEGINESVAMGEPLRSDATNLSSSQTKLTEENKPLEVEEEEDILVNDYAGEDEEEEIEAWTDEVDPMNEEDDEEEEMPSEPATIMRRVSVSVRKPQTRKKQSQSYASSSSVTPPYQPFPSTRTKRNSASALLTQEEVPNDRNDHKKHKPSLSRNDLSTPKPNQQKKDSSKKVHSPHWWKHSAIPTTQQIQPILALLGFQYDVDTHRYSLPHPFAQKHTMGIAGLRKFLCCYGIPNYATTKSRLSIRKQEHLRRWLVFANVPCQKKEDTRRLRTISSPKKTGQLLSQLYTLGFSTVDGKLFVPEYKQMHNYQGRPVHGQHYFHLDSELSSSVRVYIRGAWRLGVVTESPKSDEEDMAPKYRDTLLPVRLWAAASSQPLPVFRTLPDDDYLRPFTQMPDEIEEEEEISESEEEEVESTEPSDEDDSVQITKVVPSPETSVASSTGSDTTSSMDDDDDSPLWFLQTALPDFTKVIWPVLHKKLGFFFRSGAYGHPDACDGQGMGNSKDLQAFCVHHGIPRYYDADLTDSERRDLYRWATFAHVPSYSVATLRDTPLLTDRQVRDLLQSQQFTFLAGGAIVPPPGGPFDTTPSQFASLNEFRVYLRGVADVLRRRTPQLVALRLWAARSAAPLPTFVPAASEETEDSDDEFMEEEVEEKESMASSIEDEEPDVEFPGEGLDDPLMEANKMVDDEHMDASPISEEIQNAPTILFSEATTPECSINDGPNAFFSCEQPVECDAAEGVPSSTHEKEEEDVLLDQSSNQAQNATAPTKLLFPESPSNDDDEKEHAAAMPIEEKDDPTAATSVEPCIDVAVETEDPQKIDDAAPMAKRTSPTVSVLETVGFDSDDDDSVSDTDSEYFYKRRPPGYEYVLYPFPPGFATQYDPDDDEDEGMEEEDGSPEAMKSLPTPNPVANALTTQPELNAEDDSDFGF